MISRIFKLSQQLTRPNLYRFYRAYCQNVTKNGSIKNDDQYESNLIAVLSNADWNSFKYG